MMSITNLKKGLAIIVLKHEVNLMDTFVHTQYTIYKHYVLGVECIKLVITIASLRLTSTYFSPHMNKFFFQR